MARQTKIRRMQIRIMDEETGEEVASASGVETLILLVAPDTSRHETYRRILMGDMEQSVEMVFDLFGAMTDGWQQERMLDLGELSDDDLLLEVTEGLLLQ